MIHGDINVETVGHATQFHCWDVGQEGWIMNKYGGTKVVRCVIAQLTKHNKYGGKIMGKCKIGGWWNIYGWGLCGYDGDGDWERGVK